MVRDVVEGVGWGRGVFLSAGDLEPFFKNFWGSEPYGTLGRSDLILCLASLLKVFRTCEKVSVILKS